MPRRIQEPVDVSGHMAWDAIAGYTRGIVIVAFADAVLVFIGLTILQVPLAPALSALVFLGAFIPVIGAPIATFFAAIVALAERGPVVALLVVLLTVVVGSFDGDVLQPLVMGKAVSLHPLAIVFAIAAGGIAMGIVGALIAVPVAGAIYKVAKYLTGRDPEHPFPDPGPPGPVVQASGLAESRHRRRHVAVGQVIVDQPARLHRRVHGRRPDEHEPLLLQPLAQRQRLRCGGRHVGHRRGSGTSRWREGPHQVVQGST